MSYSEKVIDHYKEPRNVGSFTKKEEGVGTGLVGAPECGDVMKLQIKVENNKIVDAKFKTFGCGSAIASSSLAQWLFRIQKLLKNFHFHQLRFIVLFLLRTQLRQQSVIIKIERLLNPRD